MSATKAKGFVKSADTGVSPATSKAELERMLRRYGADGLSTAQDYANWRITVQFIVPNSRAKDAQKVPVKLPVDVRLVYDALYGRPTKSSWVNGQYGGMVYNPSGYDTKKLEQAERVAWRHLLLWVDAALTAATSGVQTITEAFFAHTVITLEDGRSGRLVDYLEAEQYQLAPGVRALLASPAEVV